MSSPRKMLLRVSNLTFQTNGNKDGVATFAAALEKAQAVLKALGIVGSTDVVTLIAPVRTALAAYESEFTEFATARLAMANTIHRTCWLALPCGNQSRKIGNRLA